MPALIFAFIPALGAALPAPAAGPGPQGRMRQLVCRGAPDIDLRFDKDPSPLDPRHFRFVLYYKPAHQPVGNAFENLAPGTCSWNPFNFPGVPPEPGTLWFDVPRDAWGGGTRADTSLKAAELYPDMTSVPRYFKDANHYWNFYVDDVSNFSQSHGAAKFTPRPAVFPDRTVVVDSGGPVGKSTDRAGTSTLGTGSLRDASPTLDAARIPLTFREVVRKPNEYWFKFGARKAAGAIVEYGIVPPIRRNGVLTFHQPTPVTVQLLQEKGFAAEYSTAPVRNLTHGRKYYFVIRVPAAGKLPAQEYTGDFLTLAPYVTVRFTSIDVLNDSDKMDSGEIVFQFYLARNDVIRPSCTPTEVCQVKIGPMDWETGSKNAIDVTLSQIISTPTARIWVHADDSDHPNTNDRGTGGAWDQNYGGQQTWRDFNHARATINLQLKPGETRLATAFRLRSVDGYVLMYEVVGQAEVVWR